MTKHIVHGGGMIHLGKKSIQDLIRDAYFADGSTCTNEPHRFIATRNGITVAIFSRMFVYEMKDDGSRRLINVPEARRILGI